MKNTKIGCFSLILVSLLVSCSSSKNLIHKLPKAKEVVHLDKNLISRTYLKSLEKLEYVIKDEKTDDFVISPASYLLAVSGLSAVSENFSNEEFGLVNAENDVKELLTGWNFEFKNKQLFENKYAMFQSAVLHQQVGDHYKFDDGKRNKVSDDYISTMVSSINSYKDDADSFFKKEIDLKIKTPDLNLQEDAVVTYGAFKMKDYIPNGLGETKNKYRSKENTREVDTYQFGTINNSTNVRYFKGSNYQVFGINIFITQLVIVLPDSEENLNNINVSQAYANYINQADYVGAYGYIPYFHNKTENVDLVKTIKDVETGRERYFDKLLDDGVENDLTIVKVLQTSDFEFNKYGVAGESITSIAAEKSAPPSADNPIDLSVNRPFYAISVMDEFPIFVNKVVNPDK